MEIKMSENEKREEYGDVKMSSPLLTRLDNFWYHYKWHTIVAAFLVVVILVCSLQMCAKESYDMYVMYAGSEAINRNSTNGDIPEYQVYMSTLGRFSEDYNGDGEVIVSFSDLFVLSPKEEAESGDNVGYSSENADSDTLYDRLMFSEYYVCFVSKYVYDTYHEISGIEMFVPLSDLAPKDNSFVYESDNAIYLCSTDLYSLPGFCNLPEDTLICLRIKSEVSATFKGKQNDEYYERSRDYIKNLLAYKA